MSQLDQLTNEFISVRASDAQNLRNPSIKPKINNKSIISKYKNSMFNETIMSYSKDDMDNSTNRDVNLFGGMSMKESFAGDAKGLLQSRIKDISQTIQNLQFDKAEIDLEMLEICNSMFPQAF